jgi:tetratricopeptide (TPR) repeat protein
LAAVAVILFALAGTPALSVSADEARPSLNTKPLKPLTPPFTVNKLDILDDLRARRFDSLDTRLKAYQELAERNVTEEANMRMAFQTFENSDPSLDHLLSEWIKNSAYSYSAHLAWATYSFKQGWRARGGQTTSDISAQRVTDMESFFVHGAREAKAALSLNPKLAQAYVLLLQRERALGGTESCMKVGESVLKRIPTSFIVRLEMMKCLQPRWGGSVEAMEAFAQESQTFVADNPRLVVLKGFPAFDRATWVYSGQRDYALEIKLYGEAIEKGGDDAMFYQARGEAFGMLGQTQRAIADFERANQLSPQNQDILESLAGVQAQLGKYEEALNTLEFASRVGGPSPYAPDLRAFLLSKLGRSPKGQGVGGN